MIPPRLYLCHSPPDYCAGQIYATKVKTNRLGVTKSVWLVVWKVKGPLRREHIGGYCPWPEGPWEPLWTFRTTLCPKCSKHNSHVHLASRGWMGGSKKNSDLGIWQKIEKSTPSDQNAINPVQSQRKSSLESFATQIYQLHKVTKSNIWHRGKISSILYWYP